MPIYLLKCLFFYFAFKSTHLVQVLENFAQICVCTSANFRSSALMVPFAIQTKLKLLWPDCIWLKRCQLSIYFGPPIFFTDSKNAMQCKGLPGIPPNAPFGLKGNSKEGGGLSFINPEPPITSRSSFRGYQGGGMANL